MGGGGGAGGAARKLSGAHSGNEKKIVPERFLSGWGNGKRRVSEVWWWGSWGSGRQVSGQNLGQGVYEKGKTRTSRSIVANRNGFTLALPSLWCWPAVVASLYGEGGGLLRALAEASIIIGLLSLFAPPPACVCIRVDAAVNAAECPMRFATPTPKPRTHLPSPQSPLSKTGPIPVSVA